MRTDACFDTTKLAKEVDLVFVSRGKPITAINNQNQKSSHFRNMSRNAGVQNELLVRNSFDA